jgi:hypothetical protein
MRKLVFSAFIFVGAAAGALTAGHDGLGVVLVMMSIGAVVGTVVGGVVAGIGTRARSDMSQPPGPAFGQGTSAKDRDRNFWRDRGHPPFMKPSDPPPDRHMFDPDRQD